jgi:hypothetical protein
VPPTTRLTEGVRWTETSHLRSAAKCNIFQDLDRSWWEAHSDRLRPSDTTTPLLAFEWAETEVVRRRRTGTELLPSLSDSATASENGRWRQALHSKGTTGRPSHPTIIDGGGSALRNDALPTPRGIVQVPSRHRPDAVRGSK